MSDFIKVEIEGADELAAALDKFPRQAQKYLSAAGKEAAEAILKTDGLRRYPAATAANSPGRTKQVILDGKEVTFRVGYYIRGRGAQVPVRGGGYKSLGNSERLGTQWFVQREGHSVVIANRASYARYVVGKQQARWMEVIGWRRLDLVAVEKLPQITEIYQGWVDKLIEEVVK